MGASLTLSVKVGDMDIVNNRTPITATVKISSSGSTRNQEDWCPVKIWGTIKASGSARFGYNESGKEVLTTTQYVYHNADGTGSYDLGASFNTYVSPGTIYAYASGSLPTIPRVSDISVASSSVTIGGSQTVTTSKKTSSFTDTIEVTCGSESLSVTSGTAFTIPTEWLAQFPNASSITATAKVTTKNGSTTIGTKSVNFTIVANDYGENLSVSHQPFTDTSTKPSALNGYFIQGISKPRVQTTASGYQGSSISSIITTIENVTYQGADITSNAITGSGSVVISTKVTDSRGKSKTITSNLSVLPYASPSAQATISVSGTKATLNLKGSISPLNNGTTDLNTRSCTIKVETASTSETNTYSLSGFTFDDSPTFTIDPTITYTFTTTISDRIGSIVSVVKSGKILMSRHAGGDGVTFGVEASTSGVVLGTSDWDVKIEDATLQATLVAVLGSDIIA